MRHFFRTTFGAGFMLLGAGSVCTGLFLVAVLDWPAAWLWLCLPIFIFIL